MIFVLLLFLSFLQIQSCTIKTHGYLFYNETSDFKSDELKLMNKTKNEVYQLLGSPTIIDKKGNYHYISVTYKTIYGIEFFQKTEGIILSFGKNNNVERVRLINVDRKTRKRPTNSPVYLKY